VHTNKLEKNIINISALTFSSMPLSNISNFPNEIKQTLISAGHYIAFCAESAVKLEPTEAIT